MKPSEINILGKTYKILYFDKPSDVDIFGRKSLWGQCDFWTHTIRIYDNGQEEGELFHTILHEVLHAVTSDLRMTEITDHSEHENIIDLLAIALADVLRRNDWVKSWSDPSPADSPTHSPRV